MTPTVLNKSCTFRRSALSPIICFFGIASCFFLFVCFYTTWTCNWRFTLHANATCEHFSVTCRLFVGVGVVGVCCRKVQPADIRWIYWQRKKERKETKWTSKCGSGLEVFAWRRCRKQAAKLYRKLFRRHEVTLWSFSSSHSVPKREKREP